MKMQAGASTPAASGAVYPARSVAEEGDRAAWLRQALDQIIHNQRPRVPGWGLLRPKESVGEYAAEDAYLLLVFDHRGRPHTQRITPSELTRLQTDPTGATAQFKSLIDSFCSAA
jgi:hypothetical protein